MIPEVEFIITVAAIIVGTILLAVVIAYFG